MMNVKDRNEMALRSLHSIMSSAHSTTFAEQAKEILKTGCENLSMKCGIISYVEGNRYTVLHVFTTSNEYQISAGDVFDLGITYCKLTLEENKPLGFNHAAITKYAHHPSYTALQLESYLGAPLYFNNQAFGTLNFTSIEPREQEFTEGEKYYIQLMAQWISSGLERQYLDKSRIELNRMLEMHVQHSPLATIEWTSNFKVKKWSDKATEVLGWNEAQVINKSPRHWPITNEDSQAYLTALANQLEASHDGNYAFNCDLINFNGALISTDWFVSISITDEQYVFVQTLILNVTERVRSENELLKSNIKYVDLYENAPDMYLSLDHLGNIISANKLCHRSLQYKDNELVGKPYWNLIPKKDVPKVRRHIKVALSGNVEEWEMEVDMLTKTNNLLKTHNRILVIMGREGFPHELRILCRDITDRKIGQENKLSHVRKQRDEISREVQHRIKNSLQAVIGFLSANLNNYPELEDVLKASISQVNTIAVVNSLVLEAGDDDIDLCKLVEKLLNASSNLFHRDIEYCNKINSNLNLKIQADETIAMSLIISELLINASKYHDKESCKSIELSITNASDSVCIKIVNQLSLINATNDENSNHFGVSMISSLMPPEGAGLKIHKTAKTYKVELTISEPVLLVSDNIYC